MFTQTSHLLVALKKCLRAKGINYKDVARDLSISESSVKRIFAEETFTLKRLEEVCAIADVSIYDLAKMSRMHSNDEVKILSLQQERALADDPMLFTCFYLLLNGWSPDRIATDYELSTPAAIKLLTTLDKLKLIELLPGNKVRLLTARTINWRRGGPVRKKYEQQVMAEFLNSRFEGPETLLRFESTELSAATISIINKKIDALIREMEDLAEADTLLPPTERKNAGLMIAFRPWTFSLFEQEVNIPAQLN
ncbi:MAG: helix-turn-helix transcriptional regulator [Gammaproteobacteria bacterium]|nr:helix-turn-helix transcriptional regulator [Gammaproteobacteria bacterium]MDH5650536.1 helix-turn-helix transcriptional regulator [Gammaproteobacteria bacterium]